MFNISFFTYFFYLFLASLAFSNNLIELLLSWVGLNISLYALFVKGSTTSVEAGLKYFLVGLFVTCLLFFSIILYFINYMSFEITHISYIVAYTHDIYTESTTLRSSLSQRFLVSSVLVAFLFKLGAFPFSFYVSDIYDNVSWRTLYIYTVPLKVVIFITFLKLLAALSFASPTITPLLVWSGAGSIIVGSFSAMLQIRFRRFWAFSYITTIGFVLLSVLIYNGGLGLSTYVSKLYLIVYLLTWHIIFSIFSNYRVMLASSDKWVEVSTIPQTHWVKKLSKTNLPSHALVISLISLMGLPPALGFFSKFLVYLSMFELEYSTILTLVLLTSPITAFGYLRIVIKLITKSKSIELPVEAKWFSHKISTGFANIFELTILLFWLPLSAISLSIFFSAITYSIEHFIFDFLGSSSSIYSEIIAFIVRSITTTAKYTLVSFSWLI